MVGIYRLENSEKNTTITINEIFILNLINALDKRNEKLKNKMIEIWETLEQEKISDEVLK